MDCFLEFSSDEGESKAAKPEEPEYKPKPKYVIKKIDFKKDSKQIQNFMSSDNALCNLPPRN